MSALCEEGCGHPKADHVHWGCIHETKPPRTVDTPAWGPVVLRSQCPCPASQGAKMKKVNHAR